MSGQHLAAYHAEIRELAMHRPIFPVAIVNGDKRPLVRGWRDLQAGPEHAARVERWWSIDSYPAASIGMPTGDGLVVLDVDPRHGGEADPSWPATRTARTRSGGTHHYFATRARVPNSAGRLAPGVDVRGDGGFVVVPPSPGYVWLNELPLAELPADLIPTAPRRGDGCDLPAGWQPFEPLDYVGDGGRNDYLARLGGYLLSQGVAPIELEEWLQDTNEVVCHPPLDAEEVTRIAASISRYAR